ncbi:MAG: protein-L-isoaspartate(D-aspartate) O-methyltransferase [Neisseria sp.]|nr:protein-L-isoaspartate(D-aspartate) O-methyltransferase [Neisseria sp.]
MQAHWTGFENRRQRMVARLAQMGIGETVLQAMAAVPRHLFVEEALRTRAYDEMSLPLGLGQTISQPYTVGRMTELLLGNHPQSMRKVLEIGTGCGYQTAVLLALGLPEIYSIERLRPLHERAKKHLRAAGLLARARTVCGDGYLGLPEVAPFDGILVTAAPSEIPLALLQQLAVGGRMVLPLDEGGRQYLWLIEKTAQGYRETCVQEANFVPLVSGSDTP